jgi:Tfp pilus assembly protein PilF
MAIYVRKQNYDALARLLEEGIEIFPADPDSHYKLGLFQEFKKQYDLASGQYRQAIKIKSDHARALNALGRVYYRTGDFAKAKDTLEAARKADPNLKEPQEMLADIREDSVLAAPAKGIHTDTVGRHKSTKTHAIKKHKSKKSTGSGHAGGKKKKKN